MISFKCVGVGEKTWTPSQNDLDRWATAYPEMDIEAELRKMEVWLEANPQRRKTAVGMPRFVVNWLNFSQNKGNFARIRRPAPPQDAPAIDTAALRLKIWEEIRREHPDWEYNQARAECTKRFNAAMRQSGLDFDAPAEK